MSAADRDLTRLPQWAQNEIRRLRQDNAELRATIAAGPEETRILVDPFIRNAPAGRPVDRDGSTSTVRFLVRDDDASGGSLHFEVYLDVPAEELYVRIAGSSAGLLHVLPEGSNTIRLLGETAYDRSIRRAGRAKPGQGGQTDDNPDD